MRCFHLPSDDGGCSLSGPCPFGGLRFGELRRIACHLGLAAFALFGVFLMVTGGMGWDGHTARTSLHGGSHSLLTRLGKGAQSPDHPPLRLSRRRLALLSRRPARAPRVWVGRLDALAERFNVDDPVSPAQDVRNGPNQTGSRGHMSAHCVRGPPRTSPGRSLSVSQAPLAGLPIFSFVHWVKLRLIGATAFLSRIEGR